MKKIILAITLVISSVSFAQQQRTVKKASPKFTRPYGMAGCGLGSIIMGKDGSQISAATSNGTSWNQSFGISAGTSNCVDTPTAEVAGRMDQFILVNRSQVQGDIAKGSGETILALSHYMGCEDRAQEIGQKLKSSYGEIFETEAPANTITDNILSVIMESNLAQSCNKLG